MKKATTIEDIAAIVESTMKKETAVTFETGQVATEVMGITTRGDKGEAPVFDIGSCSSSPAAAAFEADYD